jgi:hypothetical protein
MGVAKFGFEDNIKLCLQLVGWGGGRGLGLSNSGLEQAACSFERGNELWGFVKCN